MTDKKKSIIYWLVVWVVEVASLLLAIFCIIKFIPQDNYLTYGDCKILGYPCREIGSLKNNAELVIEIDERKHRLFANVSSQLANAYNSDMLMIPAGKKDIVISGKNIFSPFKGNPFLFDRI